MFKYNENNEYDNVFHQANNFMKLVESYEKCVDFFDYNVLYINMLLSSELFLKAILIKYGVSIKDLSKIGHNLCKLYNLLPLGLQNQLYDRFLNFYKSDIKSFLNKISNDFTECRYMFANNEAKTIYFEGVKQLMYELQYLASNDLYGKDIYKEIK